MIKLSAKVKVIAVSLALAVSITPLCYAYKVADAAVIKPSTVSAPTKNKDYTTIINNAKDAKQEYEKKAEEAQEMVNNLNTEYNKLSEYLEELDRKSNMLYQEVANLEKRKAELDEEKAETEVKLADAEKLMNSQYKTMSARVKYVYENGETSFWDIIFNTTSLADILNRVEYVSEISEYDDNLYTNYVNSVKEVTEYKEMLDSQLEAIEQMTVTYKAYCDYADKLAAEKEKAFQEVANKLGTSKEILQSYLKQIEAAEMTIQDAEKAAAEEAARIQAELEKQKEQNSNNNNNNNNNNKPNNNVPSTGNQTPNTNTSDVSGLNHLIWPVPGWGGISSYFGPRKSPTAGASSYHKGIDIWCSYGTPIVAASAGTVVAATYSWDCGNYVMIQHADGNYTIYMHNSSLAVYTGQYVKQGQVIAYAGSTGISTGVHCHFGVRVGSTYVNPLNYVRY